MINFLTNFAAACQPKGSGFLGFPTWYKYLDGLPDAVSSDLTGTSYQACTPVIANINDVWLILAAVIEILLRVAALLAVGYVLYGGIFYITSQGEPDRTQKARNTVLSALVGLVVAVTAASMISFIAGRFN